MRNRPNFLGFLAVALVATAPVARAEGDSADALAESSSTAETPAAERSPQVDAAPAAKAETPAATATPDEGAPKPKAGKTDPIFGIPVGPSGTRQVAHILIQRTERAEGKHEISLTPQIQVNGRFTEHMGVGLEYIYHAREAIGFAIGGEYYLRGVQSSFTEDELIKKAKQQPFTASALLLQWNAHAGVEVSPLYGKMALFENRVLQFGFYVGAQGGLAQTRVQLRPADVQTNRDRTFGDAGLRPTGFFNAGFRFFFGDFVALRVEIRDTLFADQVNRINGCTRKDLENIVDNKLSGLTSQCQPEAFSRDQGGFFSGGPTNRKADGAIALDLVKEPSSDVLNTVSFVLGLSVLF